MGMLLSVRHPAGHTYEARIEETIVPALMLPQLKKGAMTPVRIARDDQALVELDMDYAPQPPKQ